MAVSFTSTLGAVLGAATKLSEIVNTFNNTLYNKDLILGDDAEGTGAGGHFHDFSSTVSEGESTTTSGSYVQKVSHSFTPQAAGDYMILYQCEMTHSIAVGETNMQVDLDSGTQLAFCHTEPVDADDYELSAGHDIRTLTAAAHTVDIDFLRATGSGNAKIRRARVSTWRVA
jgi:hypothetical protein